MPYLKRCEQIKKRVDCIFELNNLHILLIASDIENWYSFRFDKYFSYMCVRCIRVIITDTLITITNAII